MAHLRRRRVSKRPSTQFGIRARQGTRRGPKGLSTSFGIGGRKSTVATIGKARGKARAKPASPKKLSTAARNPKRKLR